MFRDIPEDPAQGRNEEFYAFWSKVFKVICIVVIFILVLFCAVITKGTLLFVTSQIRQNISLLCTTHTYGVPSEDNTQCVVVPVNFWQDSGNTTTTSTTTTVTTTKATTEHPVAVVSCLASSSNLANPLVVTSSFNYMCQSVTVRWLWCLLLIMVTPYFFVFARSAWYCCFKTKDNPSLGVFLVVSTCTRNTQCFVFHSHFCFGSLQPVEPQRTSVKERNHLFV